MSVPRSCDAIVVGAGANGLVAAAALGRAGMRVLLLERAESIGGQARALEFAPGFRAAPLGDDPGWVLPAVARGLGLEAIERFLPSAPVTVLGEPGECLPVWRDASRAAGELRRLSPADAARWPAFAARLRRLVGFLEVLHGAPAPDVDASGLGNLATLARLGWRFRGLGRGDRASLLRTLPMSAGEFLDDELECAPLKAAVAATATTGSRHGPRAGGTAFALLHRLLGAPEGSVRGRGEWRAGPDAFARAVEGLARRHGVEIRTGAAVARVEVKDDAVAGVALEGGETIAAPRVVSTADPARTILDWVDPVWLDPDFLHALRQVRHRGCAAVVLFALEGMPELPGLPRGAAEAALDGVVSLTADLDALERAAGAAKYGSVSDPLHVEFTVPSRRWPALAPAGRQVLAARAQYAPHRLRDGAEWSAERRDALADAVASALEAAMPGFASRVLHRAAFTPRDLEATFSLPEGDASCGEIALDQILFLRPVAGWARYATPLRGLYWGGRGAHPGPGVLGGAGWLAARRLLQKK